MRFRVIPYHIMTGYYIHVLTLKQLSQHIMNQGVLSISFFTWKRRYYLVLNEFINLDSITLNREGINIKYSIFHSLVNPQKLIPFVLIRYHVHNQWNCKYNLRFPDVITYFLCFIGNLWQILTAGNNELCWFHTMVKYLIPTFYLQKWNITMLTQNVFLFHLDTLTFANSVLSNTPLPSSFKLKNYFWVPQNKVNGWYWSIRTLRYERSETKCSSFEVWNPIK